MDIRDMPKTDRMRYLMKYYGAQWAEDCLARDVEHHNARLIDGIKEFNNTGESFHEFIENLMVIYLNPTINEARLITELRISHTRYGAFRQLARHETFYLIDLATLM